LSEDFPAQLAGFRRGSLVAGYRLEAQIGAGGMAVVFRARDERLGRLVALKILAPALASDEGFRRRFIAESRAAAAVDDPHIIPVYEAGEAGSVLFIAMRFVIGGDLRRVLEQEGPLSPGRAVEFISPVASALDAAHGAGLVHRDVKPANILVDARPDRADHVYLSDFGVSKGALSSVSLTGTGQFLGTPHYSAPEQIQGLAVDGRTDQYALACVAYELLTGVLPFERDQGMAVMLAHLSQPPPSLGAGFPRAADEVLARALAKAPEKRYGSCRDFADALRQAFGLISDAPRRSASASGRPQPQIAEPRQSFRLAAARAGTADPSAAATIDRLPDSGPANAATVPPAAVIATGSLPLAAARASLTGTSWSSGVENALAAGPVRATLSETRPSHRALPRRSGPGRQRWPIVTGALVALVAVVVLGGFLLVHSTAGQYYLTVDGNGQVVIDRGVSDKILWINLSHAYDEYEKTGIPLAQVPTNEQQTVTAAYTAGSLSHVEQSVANVRTSIDVCQSQYRALAAWVARDDRYQFELLATRGSHRPNKGILKPGPRPSGAGPTCQPPQAFGIALSTLSPTAGLP
jgi:serine/threonine protein kinase